MNQSNEDPRAVGALIYRALLRAMDVFDTMTQWDEDQKNGRDNTRTYCLPSGEYDLGYARLVAEIADRLTQAVDESDDLFPAVRVAFHRASGHDCFHEIALSHAREVARCFSGIEYRPECDPKHNPEHICPNFELLQDRLSSVKQVNYDVLRHRLDVERDKVAGELAAIVSPQEPPTGLELSAKQREIFDFLWKNKHRDVTVDELEQNCWKDVVQPEAVTKAINRLNEKLMIVGAGVEVYRKGGNVILKNL